jgi:hypothetical protein
MTKTRLSTAAAISLALAGASGVATAEITGIPAEFQLGPMVLHDPAAAGNIETYIALTVPLTIGTDTVLNLAAPNVLANGPVTQTDFDPRIHWVLFDENSEKVENGICEVSPGDTVLWTTDAAVQVVQQQQQTSLGTMDKPASVCGPSNPGRFNYVVFQTFTGSDGLAADFAFWADGGIVDNSGLLTGNNPAVAAIPMLGGADGADPVPASSAGNGEPSILNSVINNGVIGNGIASDPVKYAPILSGVRMNDSDANQEFVYLEAPIQGLLAGFGQSLHVFWFDRNNPDRIASVDLWDDQEEFCSFNIPVPRELNLWMYNYDVTVAPNTASAWANLAGATQNDPNRGLTDIISAVQPNFLFGYNAGNYCLPAFWNANPFGFGYPGAIGGVANYELDEINDPQPTLGTVNSAAAAFTWQESVVVGAASWSSHAMNDLGKQ